MMQTLVTMHNSTVIILSLQNATILGGDLSGLGRVGDGDLLAQCPVISEYLNRERNQGAIKVAVRLKKTMFL